VKPLDVNEVLRDLQSGEKIIVYAAPSQVMDGSKLFYLHDTLGTPLVISLSFVMEHKLLVDWNGWIDAATAAGWSVRKTLTEILYSCQDSGYGGEYIRATFRTRECENTSAEEKKE